MSEADSLGARLIRILMLFCALIYGFGFWVNRAFAFTDFRILHLGSGLVGSGRAEDAYNPETFSLATANDPVLSSTARELDVFWSTPVFASVMRPFTLLSSNAALIVWMALGVAAVFGAVKLLRLPLWAGVIVFAAPFGIANIYHAQTGFLALLWAATIHRLCVDGKTVPAGLVAGLAVLKPTLLLGVALWWLLDWRRWYPALASALAVGTVLMVPTVIGGFGRWQLFIDALGSRKEGVVGEIVENQPTLGELVSRAVGSDVGDHPIALLVYLVLGAIVMSQALRRWPERTDLVSGAAVLVSVLVSPHLLIYDTPLLLIPFAVVVRAGASLKVLEQLTAIFVVTSLMTIVSFEPFNSINGYVMPGTIGLMLCAVLWVQAIDDESSVALLDGSGAEDSTPPIDLAA